MERSGEGGDNAEVDIDLIAVLTALKLQSNT